jgi:hypothetical protein
MRRSSSLVILGAVVLSFASPSYALTVIYRCGNHIPHHEVTSKAQMKEYTVQRKCTDWDVAVVEGQISTEGLAKLKADVRADEAQFRAAIRKDD